MGNSFWFEKCVVDLPLRGASDFFMMLNFLLQICVCFFLFLGWEWDAKICGNLCLKMQSALDSIGLSPSKKTKLTILHGISGIIKPARC
jgi:hypothetical protein